MSLLTYDLKTVFRCAVDLAEALGNEPSDHPTFESRTQPACQEALNRIEIESNRLKRALGASGPLATADFLREEDPPIWAAFWSLFENTSHAATVRRALWKLANAAVDLSGYASLQEDEPLMRKRGLRLLTQGLAQLWTGMTPEEQKAVRSLLAQSHAALGWPSDPARKPPAYQGPQDIPEADQGRVIDKTRGFYTRPITFIAKQQQEIVQFLQQQYKARRKLGSATSSEQGRPVNSGPTTGPPVVLRGQGERPIVRGKEKQPLTLVRYDVVKALLDAGQRGLSKDALDRKSGHGDARKVLKRLAASDADWKAVIHFPGKPGGGYRIG